MNTALKGRKLPPKPAYLKFTGDMLDAFLALVGAMDKKGSDNLVTHGKFSQSYREGAKELKTTPDLNATDYSCTLANDIGQKMADITRTVAVGRLEQPMKDIIDICSKYLSQNAVYNKDKSPAFRYLLKKMWEQPNEVLCTKGKVVKTMGVGAEELNAAKGLETDHDDPQLTKETRSALDKVTKGYPAEFKQDMPEALTLASKYLSQKTADDSERGPAFDKLISILHKKGAKPFAPDNPGLKTAFDVAYALENAPGLTSCKPDPKMAPTFKNVLHGLADPDTSSDMLGEMADVISRCADYLSGLARDRVAAQELMVKMMNSNKPKEAVKRNNIAMTYGQGAAEFERSPVMAPLLPVKDVAYETTTTIRGDMKDITPSELKGAMTVVTKEAGGDLSQDVALMTGVAGERYGRNLVAATADVKGEEQLFKYGPYGMSYGEAGETLRTAGTLEKPADSKVIPLTEQINEGLKGGVVDRVMSETAHRLDPTTKAAALHLAKIGADKGDALTYLMDAMMTRKDDQLAPIQGMAHTYSDGVKKIARAPTLHNDNVDRALYENILTKLKDVIAQNPNAQHAKVMPGVIEEVAKFLAKSKPESEQERKELLHDLLQLKGSDVFFKDGKYVMTYSEAGKQIMKTPTGIAARAAAGGPDAPPPVDAGKRKHIQHKLEDAIDDRIQDQGLRDQIKGQINDQAYHLGEVAVGRAQALEAIHKQLEIKGDPVLAQYKEGNMTYREGAKAIDNSQHLHKAAPAPPGLSRDVNQKIEALPIEAGSVGGANHMKSTMGLVANYIAAETGIRGGYVPPAGSEGYKPGTGGALTGAGAGGAGAGAAGAAGAGAGGAGAGGAGAGAGGAGRAGAGAGGIGAGAGAGGIGAGAGGAGAGAGGIGAGAGGAGLGGGAGTGAGGAGAGGAGYGPGGAGAGGAGYGPGGAGVGGAGAGGAGAGGAGYGPGGAGYGPGGPGAGGAGAGGAGYGPGGADAGYGPGGAGAGGAGAGGAGYGPGGADAGYGPGGAGAGGAGAGGAGYGPGGAGAGGAGYGPGGVGAGGAGYGPGGAGAGGAGYGPGGAGAGGASYGPGGAGAGGAGYGPGGAGAGGASYGPGGAGAGGAGYGPGGAGAEGAGYGPGGAGAEGAGAGGAGAGGAGAEGAGAGGFGAGFWGAGAGAGAGTGAGGYGADGVGAGGVGPGGAGAGAGGAGGAGAGDLTSAEAAERARRASEMRRRIASGERGGFHDKEHENAKQKLIEMLKKQGKDLFHRQSLVTLENAGAADVLEKDNVVVDKSIRDSAETDKLARKFERKLSTIVGPSTPAELRDAMNDVIIESARPLAEFFINETHEAAVKETLIDAMQRKDNEILVDESGDTETFFYGAQRLKKAKALVSRDSHGKLTREIGKKLDESLRTQPVPRKLNHAMREHAKHAAAYMSERVLEPDPEIDAFIDLLTEMENAGDKQLVDQIISNKDAAAYLKLLTSYEDKIGKKDQKLQDSIMSQMYSLLSRIPMIGYTAADRKRVIEQQAALLTSYLVAQAEKKDALKRLIERVEKTPDSMILRHGRERKSFFDATEALRGKTLHEIQSVLDPDPVVARKIQIKLDNTMASQESKVMTEVIADVANFLAVHLLHPQTIKVCKCMKSVFIQCELWAEEILRRVSRPYCTCSQGRIVERPSAFSPGLPIEFKECPTMATNMQDGPTLPCPTSNAPCPATTSYMVQTKQQFQPSLPLSPLHRRLHHRLITETPGLQLAAEFSTLGQMSFGSESLVSQGTSRNIDTESTLFNSSLTLPSSSFTNAQERPERLRSPWTTFGARLDLRFRNLVSAEYRRKHENDVPLMTTGQMTDLYAMILSLTWNVQAWRDWLQDNFNYALAEHTNDPTKPPDLAFNEWLTYKKRLMTEALQWRQYVKFCVQLTLCLEQRYKNKKMFENTREMAETRSYLKCQKEMLEISDMFSKWTHWLMAVLKETETLRQDDNDQTPLHIICLNYLKQKVWSGMRDWSLYKKHLNIFWEHKYAALMTAWERKGPVWVMSAYGAVPSGAVSAGKYADEVIWVARTTHNSEVLPGALVPSKHCCLLYSNGAVLNCTKYQVLCNAAVQWISWRSGLTHSPGVRAVCVAPGVHVGRVDYHGHHLVGAVLAPINCCEVVIHGRSYHYDSYELLVLSPEENI